MLIVRTWWRRLAPVTLGVRAMAVRDGEVLLVRHVNDGRWYLPGGGVRRRESLREALAREVREETGLIVDAGSEQLVGVYSSDAEGKSDHIVVVACTTWGEPVPDGVEVDGAAFFALDALPDDVSPGTRRRLSDATGNDPRLTSW